jgi:hypothetical protein
MKIMTIAIVAVGAYFVWQSGLLDKFAGGFGGIRGAAGANANGADGADANGLPGMPGGIGAPGRPGTYASAGGSNATVCTNGHCQHFSGDGISVSCLNGVCHSNNARLYEYRL